MARSVQLGPLDPIFDNITQYGGLSTGNSPPGDPVTVTINVDGSQPDPMTGAPILFDVLFSEPVINFTTGDVTLTGTAGASIGVVSGSGATYTVSVYGMDDTGTVTATIAAGVANSTASGIPNEASTSTDNTIGWEVSLGPSPTQVGIVTDATLLNGPQDLVVIGNLAVVACNVGSRVTCVDLTNPLSPIILGSIQDVVNLDNCLGIAQLDATHVAVTSAGQRRLTIVDISNPVSPVVTGSVQYFAGMLFSRGPAVRGTVVYATAPLNSCINAFDCSNPASPVLISSLVDGSLGNAVDVAIVDATHVAVVCSSSNAVTIVNTSNPASMSVVGTVSSSNLGQGWTITSYGGHSLVPSATGSALTSVDVSTPSSPTVDDVLTSGTDYGGAYRTAIWNSIYAVTTNFLGTNHLMVADVTNPSAMVQVDLISVPSSNLQGIDTYLSKYVVVSGNTSLRVIDMTL